MFDKSKIKLYLLVMALILFIVSCNQDSGPAIDISEVPTTDDTIVAVDNPDNLIAVLTDADLENAVLEEAEFTNITPIDGGDLGNGIEIAGDGIDIDADNSSEAENLQTAVVLPSAGGYVCYIRKDGSDERIYVHNQSTDTALLLYSGTSPIQTVACNETGKIIIFSAKVGASPDYEVYRYNNSTSTLTQLTSDGIDQQNVSMDGSGDRVAWEDKSSPRRIRLRTYASPSSYSQVTLSGTTDHRFPHLNTPGTYMALYKVLPSGQVSIARYDVGTTTLSTVVTSGSTFFTSPSINDDGTKIAYRITSSGSNKIKVKLRDLTAGTNATILSSNKLTTDLGYPKLGGNGDYVSYTRIKSGTYDVYTTQISSGVSARMTYSNTTNGYNYYKSYWQWASSSSCVLGTGILGTCTLGP